MNIRPEEHIRKTPIFHITSILNLNSILKCSKLLALNYLREIDFKSIANNDVQSRRSQISINHPPYGTLHDYVPFYFAPRSPMLYANKETRHEGSIAQEQIIYLISSIQKIINKGVQCIFYDMHPVLANARCFYKPDDINNIKWEIFFEEPLCGGFSKYWQNENNYKKPFWAKRKELRQAEFLVYKELALDLIEEIITFDDRRCDIVKAKMVDSSIKVRANKDFYF